MIAKEAQYSENLWQSTRMGKGGKHKKIAQWAHCGLSVFPHEFRQSRLEAIARMDEKAKFVGLMLRLFRRRRQKTV